MQQYRDYLRETYSGQDCYIDPQNRGWASYKIDGDECYINHCYIVPEHRNLALMSELCSHIEVEARGKGCKFVTGTVDINSTNPIRSLKMMVTDGYRIHSAHNNIIVMIKDL